MSSASKNFKVCYESVANRSLHLPKTPKHTSWSIRWVSKELFQCLPHKNKDQEATVVEDHWHFLSNLILFFPRRLLRDALALDLISSSNKVSKAARYSSSGSGW